MFAQSSTVVRGIWSKTLRKLAGGLPSVRTDRYCSPASCASSCTPSRSSLQSRAGPFEHHAPRDAVRFAFDRRLPHFLDGRTGVVRSRRQPVGGKVGNL